MYSKYTYSRQSCVTLWIITQSPVFCNIVVTRCRGSRTLGILQVAELPNNVENSYGGFASVVILSPDIHEFWHVLKPWNNTRQRIIIGSERNRLAWLWRTSTTFFFCSVLRTTVHIHPRASPFPPAICARLQMRLALAAASVDVKRTIRRKDSRSRAVSGLMSTSIHVASWFPSRPFTVSLVFARLWSIAWKTASASLFSPRSSVSAPLSLAESSFRDRPISLSDQRETSTRVGRGSLLWPILLDALTILGRETKESFLICRRKRSRKVRERPGPSSNCPFLFYRKSFEDDRLSMIEEFVYGRCFFESFSVAKSRHGGWKSGWRRKIWRSCGP